MDIVSGRTPHELSRPGPNVTGSAWGDPPVQPTEKQRIGNVFFTPGSRTYWHTHEVGQVLVVMFGRGLICTEDGTPQPIIIGDRIWIPEGEKHWHGASPDSAMVHLAVTLGPTTWLEEVAEADYLSADVEVTV